MQTEIFTLCDAATIDAGGKLNILGSFDRIYDVNFTCHHPICALAIKLRFDIGEDGHHTLDITFSDPDMQPVLTPIHHEFDIQMGQQLSHAFIHAHHF